jgi:adenosine deaminase
VALNAAGSERAPVADFATIFVRARSIEDPRLVSELALREIPLEVSPVSNVATGVYGSLQEHPFARLRDGGVVVTLNSDDPAMLGAWVDDIYEAARATWAFTDDELADLAADAVRSSFADDATEARLRAGIDAGWHRRTPRRRVRRSATARAASPTRS